MLQKPLNKITLNDITDDCGVSHMTFYSYFNDIYDLVEWTCEENSRKALDGNRTYGTWQQGLLNIFNAVLENKPFILNVYHSVFREQVERYLYRLTYGVLIDVVKEKSKDTTAYKEEKRFIADFYRYEFVGLILN